MASTPEPLEDINDFIVKLFELRSEQTERMQALFTQMHLEYQKVITKLDHELQKREETIKALEQRISASQAKPATLWSIWTIDILLFFLGLAI